MAANGLATIAAGMVKDSPPTVTRRELEDVFGVTDRTLRNHLPELELSGRVRAVEEGTGTRPTVYATANVVPALAETLGKLPARVSWSASPARRRGGFSPR